MLYGIIFLGSLLYFSGERDSALPEIARRAAGAGMILSAFLSI